MITELLVALLSLAGTLTGAYFAHRRSSALIAYRLEQLERKVQQHNNLIERTYALERRGDVLEEKLRSASHRIDELERLS